ncbi:uncharacterized protein TNCV_3419251 [Trichonephila clavipes]|nr:uncharacterized protein TNCV_3419251 [Trichonephila clavipes]
MYLFGSLPNPTPLRDMISTRKPESLKTWDAGWCLNSQSHAIMGRAGHQHLFSPLIGVWEKIHLYGWYYSDRFFRYSHSERVKHHQALLMKHFCAPVRDWPDRWIGRQGPVLWPPRSPDLTALDFFLWSHLKELVCRDVVTTQMDLVARLHAAYLYFGGPRGAAKCDDSHSTACASLSRHARSTL